MKPITDVPHSLEAMAATIAAADRRLGARTREVERYLASTAADQRTAPAAPAPPGPAVTVAAGAQPLTTRRGSLAVSISRLARFWWVR